MAFKCEICKARDAKRQFIGSVLNGDPEKELYICNECYEKMIPKLTWKSLGPLLTLQQNLLEKTASLKNAVSTTLATATLKIFDKIEDKMAESSVDFFARDMVLLLYMTDKDDVAARDKLHTMSFRKPFMDGNIKVFPVIFDDEIANIYMSLDPENEKKLLNLVAPATAQYFAPAFSYVGVGVDYITLDVVDFFTCLLHAVDLVDSFKNGKRPLTNKEALEEIKGFLNDKYGEKPPASLDKKPSRRRHTVKDSSDEDAKSSSKKDVKKKTIKPSATTATSKKQSKSNAAAAKSKNKNKGKTNKKSGGRGETTSDDK